VIGRGGDTCGRKVNRASQWDDKGRDSTDGERAVTSPTEGGGKGGKKTGVVRKGVRLAAGEELDKRKEM
jgi:hypothetical protein